MDAPRYRNRAANAHIKVRQFGTSQWAGAVHACSGFTHKEIFDVGNAANQVGDKLFSFPRSRAVANRNQRNVVFFNHVDQRLERRLASSRARVGVDRGRRQHGAGGRNHRNLAAAAKTWVNPQHNIARKRRLEQQRLHIVGKHCDCVGFGDFG